jgi:hypothetical protein
VSAVQIRPCPFLSLAGASSYGCLPWTVSGDVTRCTNLHQFLAQPPGRGLPCPGNEIVLDPQVESVGRFEIRVAHEFHDFVLAEALGKPIADGCSSQIVELTTRARILPKSRPKLLMILSRECK